MLIIDCGAVPSSEHTKQICEFKQGYESKKCQFTYLFNKKRILCFSTEA